MWLRLLFRFALATIKLEWPLSSKILTMQTLRGNLSLTDSVWLRLLLTFALVTMRLEWPWNCFGVALPRILCHPGERDSVNCHPVPRKVSKLLTVGCNLVCASPSSYQLLNCRESIVFASVSSFPPLTTPPQLGSQPRHPYHIPAVG